MSISEELITKVNDCLGSLLKAEEQGDKVALSKACSLMGALLLKAELGDYLDSDRFTVSGTYGCYGHIYENALNTALEHLKKEPTAAAADTAEEGALSQGERFIKLFLQAKRGQKEEIYRLKQNESFANWEKKRTADEKLIELLKRYDLKTSGRPGGSQEDNSGLNVETVTAYLRKMLPKSKLKPSEEEIEQVIEEITDFYKGLRASSEDKDVFEGEKAENSKADNDASDGARLLKQEARRFSRLARAFYDSLRAPDKSEEESKKEYFLAKDFLTLLLFQTNPATELVEMLAEAKIIEPELFTYLEANCKENNAASLCEQIEEKILKAAEEQKKAQKKGKAAEEKQEQKPGPELKVEQTLRLAYVNYKGEKSPKKKKPNARIIGDKFTALSHKLKSLQLAGVFKKKY